MNAESVGQRKARLASNLDAAQSRARLAIWWLDSDGRAIASGDGVTVTRRPGLTIYTVRGIETLTMPLRESVVSLWIEGKCVATGKASCARWGLALDISGADFRIEAAK